MGRISQHRIGRLKKELLYLLYVLIALLAVLEIVFYKGNLVDVLKSGLGIFWLFVLPGYAALLYWSDELSFLERLIYGTIAGLGIIGSLSYFLGLYGIHSMIHGMLIPIIVIAVGVLLGVKDGKREKQDKK